MAKGHMSLMEKRMEKKMSGDDHKPKEAGDQLQESRPTNTASLAERHSTHHKEAVENKPADPGELLTGQTDPGLTLTGGGGHA
jgi:hypothetical protein